MPINGCQKGKRGERAWRDFLLAHGISARRGRQFSGSPDSPDVVSNDNMHWEVKWVESLNIWKAIEQAVRDCGKEKTPAVAFKRNKSGWMVALRAEDYIRIISPKAGDVWPSWLAYAKEQPADVVGKWVKDK
jgi:hypothetical protein